MKVGGQERDALPCGSSVAVVGAGVAGLTAAIVLARKYRVVLFERNDTAGGHTNTVVLEDGPDAGTPVDTGFIVMNHRNYPLLTRLFEMLGVELRDSDMSFSYWDQLSGLQYSGSGLNGLFAQRRNLVRPHFYRMIGDVLRFYRRARRELADPALETLTLGEYLARGHYSATFVNDHILPMGAAIWSSPCSRMLDFPAASFLRFFQNHGLLSLGDRPQWRTVVGGSHQYVKRMLADFPGEVLLNSPVRSVERETGSVRVTADGCAPMRFDRVVIAAHADQALAMLGDASDDERRLLGPWIYEPNHTVLHADAGVMPPVSRAWASWNFVREREAGADVPTCLTYHMNRLQGLVTRNPLFVTLNRCQPYASGQTIREITYEHPTYSREALASQHELARMNGCRGTFFCGSYFGHGFHEDAVRSAVDVVRHFGLDL